MTLLNKVKWILGILMVFFLILMTNLIDRNHFAEVENSISTIYKDRLIANDLIIDILKHVHEKELELRTSDTTKGPTQFIDNIESLLATYEETKLTREEEVIFDDLKSNFNRISELEQETAERGASDAQRILETISQIQTNLYSLSEIQISEGRNVMMMSRQTMETVELFTQIEIYVLIALALLIQVIVMYRSH